MHVRCGAKGLHGDAITHLPIACFREHLLHDPHLLTSQADPIAPGMFGKVHGVVRRFDQGLTRAPMLLVDRDPDTGGDGDRDRG